jgi:transcriptional regulator with GAF, ATPase, and Fis domain
MAVFIEQKEKKIHLLHPITTLGSSPDNHIRIKDGEARPDHARIILDKNVFVIEAVGREGPVRVNGKPVKKARLSEGDVIRAGGTEYLFSYFATAFRPGGQDAKSEVLGTMHAFSLKLMAAADLNAFIEVLMDDIMAVTRADKGFLVLKEGEAYRLKTARNVCGNDLEECRELSDSIINNVAGLKKSILISDAPQDTEFGAAKSIINLRLKSIIGAPMVLENEVLGLIYVGSEKVSNLFDQEDMNMVTVFASQAALIIKNLMLIGGLRDENRKLRDLVSETVIYQSTTMENVMRLAQKVSESAMPVLILGQTGTGKELVAREIHRLGARREQPFVTVNCSAIPENLVESELFGHKKGAFTSAYADKKGKFEIADGGTIFLDEIGDMPAAAQSKLLRVLETMEIETVGETRPKKVDVRVISATHRDLKQPDFREDLYYRICGVEIKLPPLRERGMDSLYIARAVLEKYGAEKKRGMTLAKSAESAILQYGWPGNVRELRNRVIRAATLCQGTEIDGALLELGEGAEAQLQPLNEAKERFARNYIKEVLALNKDNKTRAAKDLGVDPRTIYRYLDEKEETV